MRLIGSLHLQHLSPASVQSLYGTLLKEGLSKRSVEQVYEVLHRASGKRSSGADGSQPGGCGVGASTRPGAMRTLSEDELRRLCFATHGRIARVRVPRDLLERLEVLYR